MPLQCPHCQSTIVFEGKPPREVVCPSCGSTIQLDPGGTAGWLPEHAPKRLGKFEFLEQLGTGAFGTVYKARDTELDRTVAIKVPRSGSLPSGADLDRFLREAKSAAQLRHPGIVSVHEVGQAGSLSDGQAASLPYIVSEFVQGATLAERLDAKRFSVRQAAELVAEVADALQYAHQHGVVHRDLKPSNIMLDLEGRPHLLDFGLAKRAADEITMTLEGQVLGTPAYMAPEQARGEVRKVDARSDLYSLGVILYELLTGELPFRGQTRMLLVQVIQDEPRPPRRLNDRIPRDLETICLKVMAKEPARRYPTARELADDLRRFLKGEPIQARPVGRAERFGRWCRRNPLVVGLTAAVAVLLLAGAGISTVLALQAIREKERAEANEKQANDKAELASKEKLIADRRLYISDMRLAQHSWEDALAGHVMELLDGQRPEHTGGIDLRDFEWHYWNSLCHSDLLTLEGHADGVTSVAFSPDGKRLATAGADQTVKLWDATSGQETLTLKGHTSEVLCVVFSPDGRQLASASADQTARIWDTASGQEAFQLKGHTGAVHSVAFGPDGKRLASAGADRTVRVWDATSGRLTLTLQGHMGEVYSVAFSPDGKRLASASEDSTVRVWDPASGHEIRTLKGHSDWVNSVAFSPDGERLASASNDRTMKVWNTANGRETLTLRGHSNQVYSVAFSPDGKRLASAGLDQTVRIWDAASGQETLSLKGHSNQVRSVVFSPEGSQLASASADRTAKVWDAASGQATLKLKGSPAWVYGVAFSPDGQWLASTSEDERIVKIWDVATGQEVLALRGHSDRVSSVAFSPDSKRLASASFDHTVKVWEVAGGRETLALQGHTDRVLSVAFSPDGRQVASSSDDRTVKVWDAVSGQETFTLRGHSGHVLSVAFSPDGRQLASAGDDDRTVKVWDAVSGQEATTLRGHTAHALTVAFSPDGKRLASASSDRTVRIWDVTNGKEILILKGHIDWVISVAFSPDGKRLASAGWDHMVKVWDTISGQEMLTLKGHTRAVVGVAFSPDGQRLASASHDQTVRVWDARSWTPKRRGEREALSLLDYLLAKPLRKADVIEHLKNSSSIRPQVRQTALAWVERFQEETNPKKFHAAAWPVLRHPHANVFMCQFALAQMNAACERAPDNASYRIALGIAQYRLGKFQKERYAEALGTLTKCDPNQPATLAFLAMTHWQLGQKEQARATLAGLREVIKHESWTKYVEVQGFLREAEACVQ